MLTREEVIWGYRMILGRDPESDHVIEGHQKLSDLMNFRKTLLNSDEFNAHNLVRLQTNESAEPASLIPERTLPDLTKIIPQYYDLDTGGAPIFKAQKDEDFDLLEQLIKKHCYYDNLGVWTPKIDLDKKVIAATVRGLGVRTFLELGCFAGSVLSLLQEEGLEVTGLEVSHLAFVLAYTNIRNNIIYGDLLEVKIEKTFDVIYAMDVIEHLNPTKLSKYISKISSLMNEDGFVYINSPMFGHDDLFGNPFPTYLPEWDIVGDNSFWRNIHCDEKGWPMHGHLVWASPSWWENQFQAYGLIRDREIESAIQSALAEQFKTTPARASFFVLKRSDNRRQSNEVIENVLQELANLPELVKS